MQKSKVGAPLRFPGKAATNFTVVPIEEVTASGLSVDTGALRPIVLVVDDELSVADAYTKILNQGGYAAVAAYDCEGALEMALLMPPDLLIADATLPGMSGIELAIAVNRKIPDCKILLIADPVEIDVLPAEASTGKITLELLVRPIAPTDLLAQVSATIESGKTELKTCA
jgi:DNA-binding response OmpR family regulator